MLHQQLNCQSQKFQLILLEKYIVMRLLRIQVFLKVLMKIEFSYYFHIKQKDINYIKYWLSTKLAK